MNRLIGILFLPANRDDSEPTGFCDAGQPWCIRVILDVTSLGVIFSHTPVQVTRNLVSQFGGQAYGRAWDYNYTGGAKDIMEFLDCEVGEAVAPCHREAAQLYTFCVFHDRCIDHRTWLSLTTVCRPYLRSAVWGRATASRGCWRAFTPPASMSRCVGHDCGETIWCYGLMECQLGAACQTLAVGQWGQRGALCPYRLSCFTCLRLVSQPADVEQVNEAELLERAVAGLGRMAFFGIIVIISCHAS
jgi:hypothetical protein